MSIENIYPDGFFGILNRIKHLSDEEWKEIINGWDRVRKSIVIFGEHFPVEERKLKVLSALTAAQGFADSPENEALHDTLIFTALIWSLTDRELKHVIGLIPTELSD